MRRLPTLSICIAPSRVVPLHRRLGTKSKKESREVWGGGGTRSIIDCLYAVAFDPVVNGLLLIKEKPNERYLIATEL